MEKKIMQKKLYAPAHFPRMQGSLDKTYSHKSKPSNYKMLYLKKANNLSVMIIQCVNDPIKVHYNSIIPIISVVVAIIVTYLSIDLIGQDKDWNPSPPQILIVDHQL